MRLVPPDPPLSDGVILLRPIEERDLPAVERALCDQEILRWFGPSRRSAAEFLAAKERGWAEGTAASFAICDVAAPAALLGQVFVELDDQRRGSVGYWLLADARGHGRATRAVRLVSAWALAAPDLARLQLSTEPDNVASRRVAERSGFQREGVLRAYLERPDGQRADTVFYSRLPSDPS